MDFIFPSLPLQAAIWGGIAGSALLLGAGIGYFVDLPHRVVSSIMAFGSGVLISALAFDLMEEAVTRGGISAAVTGFLIGIFVYSAANAVLDRVGAKHRKRSRRSTDAKTASAGTAIALGALIDGVPESAAIGVSLLDGEGLELVALLAIFVSNIPGGAFQHGRNEARRQITNEHLRHVVRHSGSFGNLCFSGLHDHRRDGA